MYGDVVLGHEAARRSTITIRSKTCSTPRRRRPACKIDTELTAAQLKELVAEFKQAIKAAHRQGFSERSDGAGLGRDRRRVRQLDERPRRRLSPHLRHSARLGHRRQRAGDGLRQPGRRLRHRRGHDPRRRARRAGHQRRLSDQRPGRRRRGRHSHAASASKRRWQEDMPKGYAELVDIGKKLEPHYRTCRTSSSPSSAAKSGCCKRATPSAPVSPPCASPSTWSTKA